eukprot:2939575-Lingulodinium_polyedra.AAC.1
MDADGLMTEADSQARTMRTRQPTWARRQASQEAFYLHPLTRASLDLALQATGDMPEISMPPDGIACGQPFVKEGPDGDGTVEVSLAAGDLLVADLPAGARVTLRGA